jgi:hypothetical protein
VVFLVTTFVLALYILAALLLNWGQGSASLAEDAQANIFERILNSDISLIIVVIFTACALIPLGNMVFFHAYCIATNTTTNEELTQVYKEKNPYDDGVMENVRQILLGKVPPSLAEAAKDASASLGPATAATATNNAVAPTVVPPVTEGGSEAGSPSADLQAIV